MKQVWSLFAEGKVDIVIITETKLYSTFPSLQFMMKDYSEPYRDLTEIEMGKRLLCIF